MREIMFEASAQPKNMPWLEPTCLLLVLGLALATSQNSRIIYLRPGDGQGFADAVAQFGSSGTDMTIFLPPGRLSLHNVTFKDAVPVSMLV